MARCVTFDRQTARAVSKSLHLLTICDPGADALQCALHGSSPFALLALPAEDPNRVLLARIRRRRPLFAGDDPSGDEPTGLEPGGFLGLSDQLVYEWEQQPPRKWWQKILD